MLFPLEGVGGCLLFQSDGMRNEQTKVLEAELKGPHLLVLGLCGFSDFATVYHGERS